MNIREKSLLIIGMLMSACVWGQVSQISINRIEQMPNEPSPYNVRDWKEVALKFDSFVYDGQKTGEYLPLVTIQSNGVNYPQNPAFGLQTYVGTFSPPGKEAINILPSLVGATLVGADKTMQYGRNWVLMSQDFFNKNNGELIYLNNPGGSSGGDWWYDLMPNIYFYQLYELYPDVGGDEDFQFNSIADRFAEAVKKMGGNDAPWQKAYMNYRAWNFVQMEPNPGGVVEPEAAGAYAWVLYHAWKEKGEAEYLKAAEWSMEFLNEWDSNPSYELQLPYGVYTAAKMNAEIGTDYDVGKMVNWCFDRGALRGWGAIVGRWGGFDVSGLIGEANDGGNDYAFQMNGVQQVAALAPMVRYDKRFARAIGKYILNLANATRLFYPGYLPSSLQDASAWSNQYDPDRVIGYEALREQWQGNSPFSTGDALRGGWAATNLALYGTSSIGYLGAIVEATNVLKILKIDVLKTDFYGEEAYPTYLFFNPYGTAQIVELDAGSVPVDIYEALSKTFLMQNVNGIVSLTIPADQAVLVTLAPAGGDISYENNKMLIDGKVVDFMQTAMPYNYPPRIQALAAENDEVEFGDSVTVYGKVFDRDSDDVDYAWSTTGGTISGSGTEVKWHAPAVDGNYTVTLIVTDDGGKKDTATLSLTAVPEINVAPEIIRLEKNPPYVETGGMVFLEAFVVEPNNDPVTYEWTASGGSYNGTGSSVTWTAPATEGIYNLTVTVRDDEGLAASETTSIWVRNFSSTSGEIIAWYPFSGNADDISGNGLHGTVSGARYTEDVFGNAERALFTDGVNDKMTVNTDPLLNFQDAITLSFWFKPELLPDRESFLVSHGSWQNRWKASIIQDHKIRWTVNTFNGIGDLDSEVIVEQDSFYYLTVTYDGEWMAMYINGELQSYRTLSGNIRTTTTPLLVGQMLPDDAQYNFRGITDEIKIFDYALTPDAVANLYAENATSAGEAYIAKYDLLLSPNPVKNNLLVQFNSNEPLSGTLTIFDLNGRRVKRQFLQNLATTELKTGDLPSGIYIATFTSDKITMAARFIRQ